MIALLLIAALGFAETQAAPQAQTPAATGTISGVVRIGDSNTTLAGAVVHFNRIDTSFDPFALDLNRKPVISKTTENGRFNFPDLPAGRYQLWIEDPPGYVWIDRRNFDGGITVALAPPQQVNDIVFRFSPRGNISGRVTDANGEPLVGALVEAACVIYRDGVRGLEPCEGRPAKTDVQGNYRIFWLSPGKYYVRTEYHPSTDDRPPMVYLPGTLDEGQATAVEIKPGSELTGMNFSLVTPPSVLSYTVSGKVVGLPTQLASKAIEFVHLFARDGKSGGRDSSYTNTAGNIANGQFQIRGVSSGAYELWTQVRDDNGLLYTARAAVEVAGASVDNIIVETLPVVDLHGRILIDGKPPEKPFGPGVIPPRIAAIDGTPDYTNFQYEARGIQFNRSTGEFTILRVPAGRYKITNFPFESPNEYLEDVRMGNRSVLDGFTISKDTSQTIEVFSNSSGGTLDIIAIGSDFNPVFGATVVHVSVLEAGKTADWSWGMKSDKNGHVSIRRLPPGQYRIYAWMNPPVGDPWRNLGFMRRYELLGQTISVTAGNTTTVRVTAIPAGDE